MTKFQALYVAFLRCENKCFGSWRWVAAKYDERYKQKIPFNYNMIYGGNQIDGMKLCKKAETILQLENNIVLQYKL